MVAVLDQIDQQVEHLRLDGNMLAAAGQFAQAGVEHMVGKVELHVDIPVFHPLTLRNGCAVVAGTTAEQG